MGSRVAMFVLESTIFTWSCFAGPLYLLPLWPSIWTTTNRRFLPLSASQSNKNARPFIVLRSSWPTPAIATGSKVSTSHLRQLSIPEDTSSDIRPLANVDVPPDAELIEYFPRRPANCARPNLSITSHSARATTWGGRVVPDGAHDAIPTPGL
ncbi:hypothetical protein C8J57DRAFT_338195 [Mycena rebaudengoi]|nr:hypothetical protein C8J57DRAFT_338195 [Mycena rebaudengoi]